jgi:hypothetical protein
MTDTRKIRYIRVKYQLIGDVLYQTNITGYSISTKYIVLAPDGCLLIRDGYSWDGPSGPTLDTKSSMRGSLIHDALYELIRRLLLPMTCRELADAILERVCCEDGMIEGRAELWEWCVKKFARSAATTEGNPEILEAP